MSSVSPSLPKPYYPHGPFQLAKTLEVRRFRRSIYFNIFLILPILLVWISFMIILQLFQLPPENSRIDEARKMDLKPLAQPSSSKPLEENFGFLNMPEADLKPGEMGKPFVLHNLTQGQKKLVSEGWKRNAFNEFVSDLISVKRALPDYRDEWCKGRQFPILEPTSVIIIFHNEAWSVLLRSVHSVLDRSPPDLIREVILVDDFSDLEHLGEQLERYMSSYPKVKILRANKRVGLIRARLMGAAMANGPILTFLDSHIEATQGWLEPLLERIALNKSNVVCPVIDVIDDDTMEYRSGSTKATSVGGFDWYLAFSWHKTPERERQRHQNGAEPVHSPTMAGGLFSIDKDYFERLGTYDPGFDIWGGENLELSFKIWMCGGTLEIVPCSHVGHIFRKRSPYKWRDGVNVLRRNSIRLAKVWMDEYAEYYYERIGHNLGDYGDISARTRLRERLNCKTFKWYLENVYPEQFIPGEAVGHGEIRNGGWGNGTCLDSHAKQDEKVGLYPCHGMGGHQYWSYTKEGEIRRDNMCIDFAGQNIITYPCQGNHPPQRWEYELETGLLSHPASRKCLTLKTLKKLVMQACDASKETQKWYFQNLNSTLASAIARGETLL